MKKRKRRKGNKDMSKQTLKDEVAKISLDAGQRETANNHFKRVRGILNNLGFNNVQKQGSFGRSTVIKGQEADGFDMDIAYVVPWGSNYRNNTTIIYTTLLDNGYYEPGKIDLNQKAITIKARDRFHIDITQITNDLNDIECVYNNDTNNVERSGAIKFKNMFVEKNKASTDNSMRDFARIYKHVRDSISDFSVPSIVLEILIFNSFPNHEGDYAQEMIDACKYIEKLINNMIRDNQYSYVSNPADSDDKIITKFRSNDELKKLKLLNQVVMTSIENCIKFDQTISQLQRKYQKLEEAQNNFINSSVLSSGVFGGNEVD